MRTFVVTAFAISVFATSVAADTSGLDLPIEFKQRETIKQYNRMVTNANRRVLYLERIAKCDPSDSNRAALSEVSVMTEVDAIELVPEEYHGDDGMRRLFNEEKAHSETITALSKTARACLRDKKKRER